ncbi:hypothetical protein BCR33DRAFT_850445 [Rhizoclosmatium globosum]|uniref:Uncharacterized protein n=1 Tax=Rhizoclosmatium globosum TaxID=329046 RepID=A0A1Y2CBA7_9FUNG|nr:hypothetical protein BCR33DRAFT_850445 [Rhizoclosmatium globosum]|eukprot:ORY44309.1 hypothetical protein BCR33DRAFT_850445 [Rhizoclosmatium globosum]
MSAEPQPFSGGLFERIVPIYSDCTSRAGYQLFPTAAQLNCLEMSLPTTFTSPPYEIGLKGVIPGFMTFTNASTACGGSDLASRLTNVYGNISESNDYPPRIFLDSYLPPTDGITFMADIQIIFSLQNISAGCMFWWVPKSVLPPVPYILVENNPICGSKAPVIRDASNLNRQNYVLALVYPTSQIPYLNRFPYPIVFSKLFGVDQAAILFKLISTFKFSITVTSDPAASSAENSCVYEYEAQTSDTIVRKFTLVRYNLGGAQLLPNATIEDGCITNGTMTDLGILSFSGSSEICGSTDPSSRFSRYFGRLDKIKFYYLNAADGFFNVTVEIPPVAATQPMLLSIMLTWIFQTPTTIIRLSPTVGTSNTELTSTISNEFVASSTFFSALSTTVLASGVSLTTETRTTVIASPTSLPIKPCNSILPADATNQCPPISKPSEDVTNILASVQIPSSNTVLPKYDGNVIQIIAKLNFKLPAALGNVDASKIGNSVFAVTESVTPGKPVAVAGPSIPAPNFGSSVSGLNALALLVTPSGYSASNFSTPSVYISADVNASVTVEDFTITYILPAIITSVWYAFDLKANGILTVIASTDKTPIATVVFSGSFPSSRKRADKGPTFAIVTAVAPVDLPGSNPATTLPVTSQIQVTSVTSSFGSLLSTVQSTTVFQSVSVTQAQQQSSQTLTSSSSTATSPSSVGATSTNTSVSVKQTTSVSTIEAVGSIKVSKTSSTSSIEAIKDISKTSGTSSFEANKTPQVSATSTTTTANIGAVRQTETINIKVNGVTARAVSIVLVIFAAMMV